MKRVSVYLKLRVIGAVDSMVGNSIVSRIREVSRDWGVMSRQSTFGKHRLLKRTGNDGSENGDGRMKVETGKLKAERGRR
jgi:hypothetical protein